MRLRALALFVLALGAASAQVVAPPSAYADFVGIGRDAAGRIVQAATANDIALGVRGGAGVISTEAATVAANGARLIGWQGGIAVSTIVIGAGLAWYMSQAQSALDGSAPDLAALRDNKPVASPAKEYFYCHYYFEANYGGIDYFLSDLYFTGNSSSLISSREVTSLDGALSACYAQEPAGYPKPLAITRSGSGQYARDKYVYLGSAPSSSYVPSPSELLTGYTDPVDNSVHPAKPALADQVKTVVQEYIRTRPVSSSNVSSGTIMPGVQLVPVPNANQVVGAPVDPTIDTDKDGIPDAEEIKLGSNPNDPKSRPAGAPYVTGTDTKTVRNPDGSVSNITTTSKSDGSTSTYTVTTSTTQTSNPDNSVTTTTTTTTTTTNVDINNVPLAPPVVTLKTDKETTLPPAPVVPSPDQASCLANSGTWSGTACTGEKPKDQPCPVGSSKGATQCEEDKAKDPGDTCGDFSLGRALHHPGSYLRDVFVPCEALADLIAPSLTLLKTKFPFSLAASLNGWFEGAGAASAGAATPLPGMLGPIPLEWGWLSSLWGLIKTLVGVALWCWFIYWLIDRFTPRAEI